MELDLQAWLECYLARLEHKMERYRVLARAATAPDVVLFCLPSQAREASGRALLGGIAEGSGDGLLELHLADPLRANWLPLIGDRRLHLFELGRMSR
jgi:hypothetical protein